MGAPPYGANGELRSKLHVPSGDETVYTYDVLGNLLSVSLPSGSLIEYLVDGMGRRVGKKVDGVLVKQWLYRDSLKPAAELDGAGVLQKQFVYVAGKTAPDLVIAGGVTYRVLSDQLGSPRLVVNASDGSVAARMRHDAFGKVLEDTNPGFVPFGFAGGLYDADTELVRFGARDYDSVTGRWTAKDRIRFNGSRNFYSYAENDPANYVDSDGRAAVILAVVATGVLLYDAWQNYRDAERKAIEKFSPDELRNGPGDAYKHCLASCLTAQSQGSALAEAWGDANELLGDLCKNQPPEERQMDLENNAFGRSFKSEDCYARCDQATRDRRLEILWGD